MLCCMAGLFPCTVHQSNIVVDVRPDQQHFYCFIHSLSSFPSIPCSTLFVPLLLPAPSFLPYVCAGLVDMLVCHVPSSKKATTRKVQLDFTGTGAGAADLGFIGRGHVPHKPLRA